MNMSQQSNTLQAIKEVMSSFKEVGGFLGTAVLGDLGIEQNIIKRTYAFRYEKCTLNVDLVLNQQTDNQYLNGFSLS